MKSLSLSANNRQSGFTVIDLMFVILIVIAAVLLLPASPSRFKNKAIKIRCVNNLKQISAAFSDWVPAGEKIQDPVRFPMAVSTNKGGVSEFIATGEVFRIFQVLSNQLTNTQILICPSDKRKMARNFASLKNENLSYFVGIDADETMPQMFLAGDRNLIVLSGCRCRYHRVGATHGHKVGHRESSPGWTGVVVRVGE